jgi:hypothetical protein
VGFSEIPSLEAFVLTELTVRPNLRPITLVGVFCFANVLSWATSFFVQLVPVFLVYFGIVRLRVNSTQWKY